MSGVCETEEKFVDYKIENLPPLPDDCTPSWSWKVIPYLMRIPSDFTKHLIWDLKTDTMIPLSNVLNRDSVIPLAKYLLIVQFVQFQTIFPSDKTFSFGETAANLNDPEVQRNLVYAWPVKMKEPEYFYCMEVGPKTVRVCDFPKELTKLHN